MSTPTYGHTRAGYVVSIGLPDSIAYTVVQSCLQVFMAIAAYGTHLNVVHNDLYLKNILFNEIPKTTLVYKFRNQTYILPQCEYLFKVSDFGICSGPTWLRNSHQEMTQMTKERRTVSSLLDFDFSNHILEYCNVPPHTRDSAILLRSMLHAPGLHPSCRNWLTSATKCGDIGCWYLMVKFFFWVGGGYTYTQCI